MRSLVLACAAGMFLGGVPGAGVAGLAVLARAGYRRRSAARRRAAEIERQLPDVLRAIAAGLRAGRSVPQALTGAHEDAAEPIREALEAALQRIAAGGPVDEAIQSFSEAAGTDGARLAAETLQIGRHAGGSFPAVLETAARSADERGEIARDRAAAMAQARLSALVVGSMPAVFYALMGGSARGRLIDTIGEPFGAAVIAAGIVLDGVGVVWMRAVAR